MSRSPRLRTLTTAALALAISTSGSLSAALDRWTPLGPDGGRATSFAAAAEGAIVAATDGAGLFRSTDGGHSWAQVAAIEPGETFRFLRAAGEDGMRLWAASARALYRSDDGGRSFAKATPAFVGPNDILGVGTTRNDRDRIYVAIAYGSEASWLFASHDGGRSWRRLRRGSTLYGLAVAPSNPNVIYITELRRALRSNDGGRTFSPLAELSLSTYLTSGVIFIDGFDPDRVLFGLSGGRMAASSSGGRNLSVVGPPDSAGCEVTGLAVETRTRWQLALSCYVGGYGTSSDPNFSKFAGKIWRTVDAGRRWIGPIDTDEPAGFGSNPAAVPGGLLLGVSRLGVLRSADFGRTFQVSNRGFDAAPVCSLSTARERAGALLAGAGLCSPWGNFEDRIGDLGFFRLEDGDLTRAVTGMRDPKTPLSAIGAVQDPDDPTRWFALPGPGIAESSDRGRRWAFLSSGPPFAAVTGLAILAGAPRSNRTIFASGWSEYLHHIQAHSVVRSDDDGRTWTRIPALAMSFDSYLAPVTTPAAPERLVVSTASGRLVISHDRGATWNASSIYPPGRERGVTALVADPEVPGRLLALSNADDQGIATSVRRSLDGGRTWRKSDRGLPESLTLRALTFDPEREGLVYAGTARGIFLSEDGGASWRLLPAPGLAGRLVLTLAVDPVDPRTLYSGVAGGGGLYTLTRSDR